MNVRIPCQTLVSGFWQFPIVLYAFLTFPLPLWSSGEETFFSMWSQAEVKIWWIAFITSSGGTAAGIFCMKKSQNHLNEENLAYELFVKKILQLSFGAKIQSFIYFFLYWHDFDISGNTVWPQASGFQNSPKFTTFGRCKCSSLRSQCWMRLFLWFSNTVHSFKLSRLSNYIKVLPKSFL